MADPNQDVEVAHSKEDASSGTSQGSLKGNANVVEIVSLDDYSGEEVSSMEQTVDSIIKAHSVVIVSKSWCPFCKDINEFLAQRMGVLVHVVNVDQIQQGSHILSAVQDKTGHKTVPIVFIKREFKGGCDDVKAIHEKGQLAPLLMDLTRHETTKDTDQLETARLVTGYRSTARNPLFWFPNTVNNVVIRLIALQIFFVSLISCIFHQELWARYLAVFLVVDFVVRATVGAFLSPIGMTASFVASFFEPNFQAGPPKQFAAACGIFFSTMATVFYFVEFDYHEVVGVIWMGTLTAAAGLEAFFGFCGGCVFFGLGIQLGLIPDDCYRIYTQTRQETVDSYNYKMSIDAPKPPVPTKVDTDPNSPIALKYKKKKDGWTKDDFHIVRNMQVTYFAMPLSLAGLALSFKIASDWSKAAVQGDELRQHVVQSQYYHVIATIAAVIFVAFLVLYMARLALYPKKCSKEWDDPLRSSSFGAITISIMIFAFLLYDEIEHDTSDLNEENPQTIARIFFWIGAVGHTLLTVAKMGEWIGQRLELEHVHPHWMILPVGLSVASLVSSIIQPFDPYENSNSKDGQGTILIARFFNSFSWIMWITLFVVSFFKVITSHNSDNRVRHGVWIWLAAPCVIGMANYTICFGEGNAGNNTCENAFAEYYFMGIFFFMILGWATLPHIGFFGRDPFNFGYWIECFAIDTLAACACLFYALNGYRASQTLQWMGLVAASFCNCCAFIHTALGISNRRGVFTPEVKWGPLSFMKLTHEAFRGNMDTLKHFLGVLDLDDESDTSKRNLDLFATHFNRFRILHEEHAKHEDQVIFKTVNDFFPEHAKKYNDDHEDDRIMLEKWCARANTLLDVKLVVVDRKAALDELRADLVPFFDNFAEHLRGEEYNLNPVGRKYFPLELAKQLSREVWRITPADRWEIIIPFVINNMPRHMQRVRYLKGWIWSMPERAQQIGAIVYRNTDAVMWERLRGEVPEMIPRGAEGWHHYY